MSKRLAYLYLLLAAGCSTVSPDTSPSAISSGDISLVQTACSPVPTKGMDVCRFHDGDPVNSQWTIYTPWNGDAVSGEVRVKFGDKVLTLPIDDFIVNLDWKQLMGDSWAPNKAGLVQALATVKFKDKVVQALGYAFIVILKPGFDPIPMSSYGAVTTSTCTIEYTTAGRSRVLCSKP